jgi:hypothetical protein
MADNMNSKVLAWWWLLIWLAAASISLSACSKETQDDGYLIRVGSITISLAEFNRAVEATREEAFPGDQDIGPSALNDLRVRVLNQLTDELIIKERAAALGIYVSDQELEASIEAVKADYPDDTFEKTLLENAVSFQVWKQKLATRLLIDKVIAKELVDKVEITSKDVAIYFQNHFPKGIPGGEDADQFNKRIVQHLRKQKAEALYHGWIESLRKDFPVEVHQQKWNRLVEANTSKQ